MQKLYEVSYEILDDGTVALEQQSGVDEPNVIWLHPEQVRFIARRVCGMSEATAAKVKDLERKLSVITDRLEQLVTADWFRKGVINECDDGIEMIAKLDGLVDLAVEMDGGRLLPDEPKPEEKQPASKPKGDVAQLGLGIDEGERQRIIAECDETIARNKALLAQLMGGAQ